MEYKRTDTESEVSSIESKKAVSQQFNQLKLNDLVRDLDLSKQAAEILASRHWWEVKKNKVKHKVFSCIVMQEASDALSKTTDSDTVSTYQVSSVQLVTDNTIHVRPCDH